MTDLSVRDALMLRDLVAAALDDELDPPLLIEGSARCRVAWDEWLSWLDVIEAPLPLSIRRMLADENATSTDAAAFLRAAFDNNED